MSEQKAMNIEEFVRELKDLGLKPSYQLAGYDEVVEYNPESFYSTKWFAKINDETELIYDSYDAYSESGISNSVSIHKHGAKYPAGYIAYHGIPSKETLAFVKSFL